MAMSAPEIALWSLVLPGAVGLAAGLTSRTINADKPSLRRRLALLLPALAAFAGYAAAEIVHRGWPDQSPLRAAWPPLADLSSSQWGIWMVVGATLFALLEIATPTVKFLGASARWLARLLTLSLVLGALMTQVVNRGEFDSAQTAALWLSGISALYLTATGLTDLAFSKTGLRAAGGSLVIACTVATIALFQAGLAPQSQVLAGLIAALTGLALAGGATAKRLAGPVTTITFAALTAGAIQGHFHVFSEFDAWVWAAVMLAPPLVLVGRLPIIRKLGPIKLFVVRLAPVALAAGAIAWHVGLPTPPGSGDTPEYDDSNF